MSTVRLILMHRKSGWHVWQDGQMSAGYHTKADAISSARVTASLEERRGVTVEISVDEPEDGVPLIYRSGDDSSPMA